MGIPNRNCAYRQILVHSRLHQFGFVDESEVKSIGAEDSPYRLFLLLVRCGGFRALVPANQVSSFVECVSKGGDHVRDVSIPAGAIY